MGQAKIASNSLNSKGFQPCGRLTFPKYCIKNTAVAIVIEAANRTFGLVEKDELTNEESKSTFSLRRIIEKITIPSFSFPTVGASDSDKLYGIPVLSDDTLEEDGFSFQATDITDEAPDSSTISTGFFNKLVNFDWFSENASITFNQAKTFFPISASIEYFEENRSWIEPTSSIFIIASIVNCLSSQKISPPSARNIFSLGAGIGLTYLGYHYGLDTELDSVKLVDTAARVYCVHTAIRATEHYQRKIFDGTTHVIHGLLSLMNDGFAYRAVRTKTD